MKIKRYKQAKKVVNFYVRNYDFELPYRVLFDGTFTCAALRNQTEIRDQLQKYLAGNIKFLTTSCALHETQSLGFKLQGAFTLLNSFEKVECRHSKAIIAAECLRQMVKKGNKNHYFVATQDPDLTRTIHRLPGVPLLYISGKSIVLEKPSNTSLRTANRITAKMTLLTPFEQETLQQLKGTRDRPSGQSQKRKRGPKEPNPLSVKKKQVCPTDQSHVSEEGGRKRKRRKRVRIPQHVKDELMKKRGES